MGPLYEPSDRLNTITSWYLVAKESFKKVLKRVLGAKGPAKRRRATLSPFYYFYCTDIHH